MTYHTFHAGNVTSIGSGNLAPDNPGGTAITLSARIESGIKPAVGRMVELHLDADSLAFVLSIAAQRYPDAIRKMARELEGYDNSDILLRDHYYQQIRKAAIDGIREDDR